MRENPGINVLNSHMLGCDIGETETPDELIDGIDFLAYRIDKKASSPSENRKWDTRKTSSGANVNEVIISGK